MSKGAKASRSRNNQTNPANADVDLELRRLETLKLHHAVQRFFEISPIHGCSYIGFHKAIYEAVIWSLIMCVCIGLLVNDIVTLMEKYTSQATSVTVVFQRNVTMSYPDAAICFDVFRDQLQESINQVFNETSYNISLSVVSNAINTNTGGTDLSTLALNDANVDLVIKTTYLLIAAIVDYDLGTPGGGNAGYDTGTARAVALVQAFFTGHGYTYDQLYTQVARYMCKQMLIGNPTNVSGQPYYPIRDVGTTTTQIDLCGTAAVNWVGYTMAFAPFDDICFALNTPAVSLFKTAFDTIVFDSVFIARLSELYTNWNQPQYILPGYGKQHMIFDMRGWRGLMDPREMDSLCLIATTTGFLVGVQIDSQFLGLNRSTSLCGTQQLSDCALFNCLPAARQSADGCWPLAGYTLTSSARPSGTPICSKMYTTAQVEQLTASGGYTGQWETCIFTKCTFSPCNALVYLYETSYSSNASHGANATLYQAKLSYAVLTEYLQMDFSAMLSSLGGSMGLWCGCSLISFLHIWVFIVCVFINNALQNRRTRKGLQ